jgi:hypothetical protein
VGSCLEYGFVRTFLKLLYVQYKMYVQCTFIVINRNIIVKLPTRRPPLVLYVEK